MKQVSIIWKDSCSMDGWTRREDIEMKVSEVTTIGHLVYEDYSLYCVAGSMSKTGEFCGLMFIPKSCVIGLKEIA
jgi:hypothetical protein